MCDTMNMLQWKRISGLIAAAGLAPAAPAVGQASVPESISSLRVLDQRVTTVGYRIATANAQLCPQRQWHPGLMVHDLSQYSGAGRAQAAAAFGLETGPAVLAVAHGGPAAQAGLLVDDVLISADGAPLPRAPQGAQGIFEPTERIIGALEDAFSDGRARIEILRKGQRHSIQVAAVEGCASRFQTVPSSRYEAKADGRYVQLTTAMAAFARGDDELAALVAHELAHNILRHRARLDEAGVERGTRTRSGRGARLFRETEMEADRWAVHLMERAGYDPGAAPRLWARQSRTIMAVVTGGAHPDWATRIAAMESEIAAIARARARGMEPALPAPSRSLPPLRAEGLPAARIPAGN